MLGPDFTEFRSITMRCWTCQEEVLGPVPMAGKDLAVSVWRPGCPPASASQIGRTICTKSEDALEAFLTRMGMRQEKEIDHRNIGSVRPSSCDVHLKKKREEC